MAGKRSKIPDVYPQVSMRGRPAAWILGCVSALQGRAAFSDQCAAEASGERGRLLWRGRADAYRDSARWLQECYLAQQRKVRK